MTTATTTATSKKGAKKNAIPTQAFSKVFAETLRAYLECSDEVQSAIREMVEVIESPDVTPEEEEAVLATISEALVPVLLRWRTWN